MKKNHFKIIFLFFVLVSCKTYTILNKTESNNITLTNSSSEEDKSITQEIHPYKIAIDSAMNVTLNYSEVEMTTGSPEGILGNFVCDLSLEIGNRLYKKQTGGIADFALLNNGGLRTFLPKGKITRRKIYELMPFENQLVVVTISAEKTAELFQYIGNKTTKSSTRKNGVPVSGNIKVILKDKIPQKVILNKNLLQEKTYKIITSDYLANGGDKMSFFLNPIKIEPLGIKLRDAIIQYIIEENEKGNKLNASLDERIKYVK